MKMPLIAVLLAGSIAQAQDSAIAAQQAQLQSAQQMQQAQILAQQASMMTAQTSLQQTMDAAQQAMLSNVPASGCCVPVPPWSTWTVDSSSQLELSLKPGTVNRNAELRIKWRGDKYAGVYYTLDGWSPTLASTPYTGPIVINGPVHLRIIGVGWRWTRSPIVEADYDVIPTSSSSNPSVPASGGVLRAGTALKLKTQTEITSSSAKSGDTVPLVLDQDVISGGAVVIPRGTPVYAVLTQATHPSGPHHPATLVLSIRSLEDRHYPVKLLGFEAMQASPGPSSPEAIIRPGMSLYAEVAADTKLPR